jgi:Zn-dependent protease with chaperone function
VWSGLFRAFFQTVFSEGVSMTSQFKTALLLAMLTGIILVLGQVMGGSTGLVIAFVLALVMNVGSYWYSDKIVLRIYKARALSATEAPMLHTMVEELAANAGIPTPRLYLVPDEAPNAFATGRNPQHAVVAVTEGIVRLLSPDELRGVIAHEIGHILNRDILVQSVAGVLASVIVTVANIMQFTAIFGGFRSDAEEGGSPIAALLLAFLAPVAASLIQFAISRSREFQADATGARLCGRPLALASALGKLTAYSKKIPMHEGNPSTAHMFIVNPFSGKKMASLFSTHPPVEERIARLQAMA